MTTLTEGAFAKINLTLDVLDRREDGYHDIRSILQTVALRDDILRWTLYAALFLLALLVQTVVFGNRTILGAHPDLVAIVITCVCLREGPERGGTFALIASLVWCLSGIDQGSVCLLVLTVLPVLGSILCRAVLANRFLPSLLVCFVTLAVEQGLILLMKHFFAGVAWEQAGRALRCLLVTLPVQPAVYGLVKCIAKIGEYHEST